MLVQVYPKEGSAEEYITEGLMHLAVDEKKQIIGSSS
jgi:hypothetical protein